MKILKIICTIICVSCSTVANNAYVAGAATAIAHNKFKDKLSPAKQEALKLAYKALNGIIEKYKDDPAGLNINAVTSLAAEIAVKKGIDPTIAELAKALINDFYNRIKVKYQVNENDSTVIYQILKDFRQGVNDSLN